MRGTIRFVFWALVLAGVFVFGIGIGRVVGGDDVATTRSVTITGDRGVVTATLPTTTVTTTVTTTTRQKQKNVPARPRVRAKG